MLLVFGAFGSVVGSHVGALPVLVQQAGVTPWEFGLAGSLGMVTNILCMSAGGLINRIFSHRSVLLVMLPVAALALLFALLVSSLWAFMASFLLLSAVLGTIDLFMNAEASAVERERARPSFGTYHGMAMLALAVFALVGSVVSVILAPWFAVLVVMVPLAVAWAAIHWHVPDRAPQPLAQAEAAAPMPRLLLLLIGLATGFNVTCEVAAIQWSGQLLAATAPELAAVSGLGLVFYGLCSGTMRMFGDRLRSRYGDLRVMGLCLLTAIAGCAVLAMAPGFWPSVIAFAAVGCGLSVTYPSLISLAGRLVPGHPAGAMSYVSLVGGVPRIALPLVLGLIAAQHATRGVFAALALVAVVALLLVILSDRRARARLAAAPAPST